MARLWRVVGPGFVCGFEEGGRCAPKIAWLVRERKISEIKEMCRRRRWRIENVSGQAERKFRRAWRNMMRRCYVKDLKYWSGKGIKVYGPWHQFENFRRDMFETYREGLTLDRKNSERGYYPRNVRWVTRSENAANTRKIFTAT